MPQTTLRHLLLLIPTLLLLSSCYYSQQGGSDAWVMGEKQAVDSIHFRARHHYWVGYNFVLTDSLNASTSAPFTGLLPEYDLALSDTSRFRRGDHAVVVSITYAPGAPTATLTDNAPTDSIWVKIARDQFTQGWVRESDLLQRVTPDDPISRFIFHFSDSRALFFLSFAGIGIFFILVQIVRHGRIRIVHFRDIPSFYPTLLCLCVSGAAVIYGSIQRFVPETWVEFYYHPTLNPLSSDIPLILALFIASIWLMLIVAVAVVDELRRLPDLGDNLSYLATLGGVCMVLYLIFTLTTPFYIGYVLLCGYWYFAISQYMRHGPSHLYCGACHHSLPARGRCPHCGVMNE